MHQLILPDTKSGHPFTCPLAPPAIAVVECQQDLMLSKTYIFPQLTDNARPLAYPRATFARICRDEVGKHTALDYYLSALLLDKKLDKFASVVEDSFFEQDTLPRYYREAIMLYKQSHPAYPRVLNDTLMIQRLQEFDKLQKEYTSPVEQKNRMRREFGDTYWWYYRYQ